LSSKQDNMPGEDSFLDIVANLVGILIILIVVVGAQATASWNQQKEANAEIVSATESVEQEVKARTAHAKNMKLENDELHAKIRSEQAIAEQLAANRRNLLTFLELSKKELDSRTEKLETERRIQLELASEVNALKHEIREVEYQFTAVSNQSKTNVQTIEHYPTPIAKTVFSDEIHFQILGGKITHVPLSDLVDEMKIEWRDTAQDLDRTGQAWETVGPIGNFRLHYSLSAVPNPNGFPSEPSVRFDGFQLQAVRKQAGETIEQALGEDSEFNRHLARLFAGKTTVSFWVYPDGFEDLVVIRDALRDQGFQTASWPLEFGRPISGGPKGFRTATN